MVLAFDLADGQGRGTGHHDAGRHGLQDEGPGRNLRALAHSDVAEHGRGGADEDIVVDLGVSVTRLLARPCNQGAIIRMMMMDHDHDHLMRLP